MAKQARTEIKLDLARPMGEAVLHLGTFKQDQNIVSDATVYWHDGMVRSTTIFVDFYVKVRRYPAARVTQKAIDTQHDAVFSPRAVDELVQLAKAHYAEVK
jgi:hypothetical protein